MRVVARALIYLLVAAIFSAGGILAWGYLEFVEPGPLATRTVVLVPKGAGLRRIAAALHEAGAIDSPEVFVWGVRLSGAGRSIKAGEYALEGHPSPRQIVSILVEGKTILRRLTVPEGLTSIEIAALIEGADALAGEPPAPPPEGAVLPETYSYQYGDTRAALLGRMTEAMQGTLAELWSERAPDLPFDSPRQALILASVIEKETAVTAERSRVAAVFVNRLRRGMRLQSDPTVVYGLTGGRGPLGRELTRADLDADTPYNTYRIAGLPPGPICNPGRESIVAALNPLKTKELYFVADGTGGHVFAETLAEHNRNVQRWRRLMREMRDRGRHSERPPHMCCGIRRAVDTVSPSPPSGRGGRIW